MNFRTIYQHGFARVAACTGARRDRRPARERRGRPPPGARVLATRASRSRSSRSCASRATRSRTCCCRTPCSTASRRRSRRSSRAPPTCCRCSSSARRCATATGSTTARSSSTAAGCSASRRSPTCRPTASSTSAASSRPGDDQRGGRSGVGGADVPFGPDLLFAADDVPGLVVHVEVCEDMWVPVPPSAEAALAGATVLAQPLRQPDHRRPRRGPQAPVPLGRRSRCLAAYVYAAAGQGESTTDLSWDGQTMIYENGVLLAETDRFPDGDRARGRRRRPRPAAPGAHADGDVRRQPAHARRAHRRVPHASRFTLDPPDERPRPAPHGRALPVRARRRRPPRASTATRPTTSRSPGLQQRLRAIGDPKVVIGVSGGLDSTHALIVAAQAMDRCGRPRSDILAFTLPGLRDERRARRPTRTG